MERKDAPATVKMITAKRYGRGNGPEFAMQKALFRFLCYTPYRKVVFAIINGAETKTDAERRRLVEEGLTKGIPDIFCSVPSGGYNGLYIELKCGENVLQPWQRYYFQLFSLLGYRCVMVKDDWLEAKNIIISHIASSDVNVAENIRSVKEPVMVKKVVIAKGKEESKKKVAEAHKKPGGSNVGAYKSVKSADFAGPSGGAPAGSYPINTAKRAKAALAYAHNAPNPAGIRAKVHAKYPGLGKSATKRGS